MNNLARQKLAEIIKRYGDGVCEDPKKVEGLLRDFCGEEKRAIKVLVTCLQVGVAEELRRAQNGVPLELLLGQLTERLHDESWADGVARWGVESWAVALGKLRPAELGGTSANYFRSEASLRQSVAVVKKLGLPVLKKYDYQNSDQTLNQERRAPMEQAAATELKREQTTAENQKKPQRKRPPQPKRNG